MNTQPYCWSCNQPGGEMLHFGNIHIHNKPDCRHTAGIPDDEPEHDGKLGKDGRYSVLWDTDTPYCVHIMGGHSLGDDDVHLRPDEALDLLTWLTQKDVELQSLAHKQALRDANTKAGEQ